MNEENTTKLLKAYVEDLLEANLKANLICGYDVRVNYRNTLHIRIEQTGVTEFIELYTSEFIKEYSNFKNSSFITEYKSMTQDDDGLFCFDSGDTPFMWCQELSDSDSLIEALEK